MKYFIISVIILLSLIVKSYSQSGWFTEDSGTANTLYANYFVDGLTGWTAGANGTILKTTNGGNNWITQSYQSTNYYSIKFLSANTGIICGGNGIILKTINGGNSWSVIPGGVTANLKSIYFINNSTGWIAGEGGKILKTVNSGDTWTVQTSGVSSNLNSVCFSSANTGWAVGEAGKILKTTNGGNNWSTNTDLIIPDLSSVFSPTDSLVNITGKYTDTGGNTFIFFYRTTNGGEWWEYQNSQVRYTLHSLFFANQNKGWAVGDSGTILGTVNGGVNWIPQYSFNFNNLYSVNFPSVNAGYCTGSNGVILKTINAGYRDTLQTNRRDLGVMPLVIDNNQLITAKYRVQFKNPDTSFAILRSLNSGVTFDTLYNNLHLNDTGKVFDGLLTRISRIKFKVLLPPGNDTGNVGVVKDPGDSTQSRLYGWDYFPPQNRYLEGSRYIYNFMRPWQSGSMALSYPTTKTYVGFKSSLNPENLRKVKIVFTGYGNGQMAYRYLADSLPTHLSYAYQDMREVPFKLYEIDETDSTQQPRQLNCAFLEFRGALQDNKWEPSADSLGGKEILYIFNSNYSPASDTFYTHKNLLLQQSGVDVMYVWSPKLISAGLSYHVNDEFIIYPYTVTRPDIVAGYPLYYEFSTQSPIGIEPVANIIPEKYFLTQNYPNPFNPSTTIKFSVPQGNSRLPVTTLKIYDILGKEVEILVSNILLPGQYSFKWDASFYASGIYFYRIESGEYAESKKMILIK